MKDLIEIALQFKSLDAEGLEQTIPELALDGCAGKDGDSQARDQRLLDRLRATELHGDIQQSFGIKSFFCQKLAKGPQGSGAIFPGYKSDLPKAFQFNGLQSRQGVVSWHRENHLVFP